MSYIIAKKWNLANKSHKKLHKRKWSFSVKRLDTGYWYPIFLCEKDFLL